ncbi:predicted protein [Lichtheimia corymbifera JMRC:FSU:9682]|uniref:F-box domain-containing protein n=1 Tax=Lichtheimia corymbifera JMRC:FSU:9682 TaxID=1263082 RepID=A0A068SI66_9FUNG|nr:predicted protein [Lichtheimia corymbifera JMRC:FSU:9682]
MVDIGSLLRPFPQLQVLRLPPIPCAALFPIIDQACPQLQQLTTSNSPSRGFPDTTQGSRGLRVLSVCHPEDFVYVESDALVEYMMKLPYFEDH